MQSIFGCKHRLWQNGFAGLSLEGAIFRIALALIFLWIFPPLVQTASAATLVYAVGASNTNGKGVWRSQAWPAVLQSLLRAKGYDVKVAVNAVNGNTTSQIKSRLSHVLKRSPKIVIVSAALDNDRRQKINTSANISAMRSMAAQRGVKIIVIERPRQWAKGQVQADGLHFTAAGHRAIAAALVSRVAAMLR